VGGDAGDGRADEPATVGEEPAGADEEQAPSAQEPIEGAAPEPALQFDTVEPATPGAAATLPTCGGCRRVIEGTYFEVNGKIACDACKRALDARFAEPAIARFARAVVLGLGGALAGSLLYFAVLALTGYEVGLISIAVGIMVGWAVRAGTRGRGGRIYQVLAVALTYLAIATSYVPTIVGEIRNGSASGDGRAADAASGDRAAHTDAADDGASSGSVIPPPVATPAGSAPRPSGALYMIIITAFAFVLALVAPVLVLFSEPGSGLIGLLIIGFGLWRAWRMTAAAPLVVKGPFSAARDAPAAAG